MSSDASPIDARTRDQLDRSAPLACAIADRLCRTPGGRDDCGALHGAWPALRALGVAADPARHAEFYASAIGARIAAGASSRVLVAGCADWGMLATVASTYAERRAPLDPTVLDRCRTPLMLCAWYGAEIGLPVRMVSGDVADYRDERPFDLICTHSLLIYGAAPWRRALVANWRNALRPGGAVVTVSRLATEAPGDDDVDARAQRFGELVAARRELVGSPLDAVELRARAERFARAQISHPVGDAAALRALFESNGFDVERLDVRRIEGALAPTPAAIVGAARAGEYGEIVAVRR